MPDKTKDKKRKRVAETSSSLFPPASNYAQGSISSFILSSATQPSTNNLASLFSADTKAALQPVPRPPAPPRQPKRPREDDGGKKKKVRVRPLKSEREAAEREAAAKAATSGMIDEEEEEGKDVKSKPVKPPKKDKGGEKSEKQKKKQEKEPAPAKPVHAKKAPVVEEEEEDDDDGSDEGQGEDGEDVSEASEKEEEEEENGMDVDEGTDEEDHDEEEEDSHEKDERTLFVGNIPKAYNEKKVGKLFKDFGTIESVRLRSLALEGTKVDQAGNQKLVKKVAAQKKLLSDAKDTINAYVVFKVKEDMEKALSLNNHLVEGRHLRVDRAARDPNSHQLSVFLGNLPFDVDEETVRAHFAASLEEGDEAIDNVRIVRDPETMRGKGFGFILFKTKSAVSQALKLHETRLNKRPIRVTPCGKRTKRDHINEAKDNNKKKTSGGARPPPTGALRRLTEKGVVLGGGKKKQHRPSLSPAFKGKRSSFEGRRGSEGLIGKFQGGEKKKKPKHMARKIALGLVAASPHGKGSKPKKPFTKKVGGKKMGGGGKRFGGGGGGGGMKGGASKFRGDKGGKHRDR